MPYLFFRLSEGAGECVDVDSSIFISFQPLFLFFLSLRLISSAVSFSRVADEGGMQLFVEQNIFLEQLVIFKPST